MLAACREPTRLKEPPSDRLQVLKVDIAQEGAADALAKSLEGVDFLFSCLGTTRGEEAVVAKGTRVLLAAAQKANIPRMAIISSVGVGDSGPQLRRSGLYGWIAYAVLSTLLRKVKADLTAAEELVIGEENKRPEGVSCVVVRPGGLSYVDGDGHYEVARADGTIGTSIAREDVARFMLTLATDRQYDNSAVSVGANAPRVYKKP